MEKVAFLSLPEHLDSAARHVSVLQTHHAWVFMTQGHVYKLKKPVRDDRLDYSTLAAREWACREELRLNRRLAPETYLDVVPLRRRASGSLSLNGDGVVVDWLVKMRRLPKARMLDALIRTGRVTGHDIDRVVARLVTFYRDQPPSPPPPDGYASRVLRQVDSLRDMFRDADAEQVPDEELASLTALARRLSGTLERRGREGHVRELHGDLRPEHICLAGSVQIFDCLEFDAGLRTMDCLEEMLFLSMECARAGDAAIGNKLWRAYTERMPDTSCSDALVALYTAKQALIRTALYLRRSKAAQDHWYSVAAWYRERATRNLESPF
jgi:aminoglycoside phosphotransferase family enzyme